MRTSASGGTGRKRISGNSTHCRWLVRIMPDVMSPRGDFPLGDLSVPTALSPLRTATAIDVRLLTILGRLCVSIFAHSSPTSGSLTALQPKNPKAVAHAFYPGALFGSRNPHPWRSCSDACTVSTSHSILMPRELSLASAAGPLYRSLASSTGSSSKFDKYYHK